LITLLLLVEVEQVVMVAEAVQVDFVVQLEQQVVVEV
jgi:hypothetical protein